MKLEEKKQLVYKKKAAMISFKSKEKTKRNEIERLKKLNSYL